MIEAKIDASELERLVERLDGSPEIFREARRQAMEEAAPQLKTLLDAEIGGTGKVRGWQGQHVGSLGGYAAVRPNRNQFTEPGRKGGRRYPVGYVTNAIDSGHAFPHRGGKRKKQRFYQKIGQRVPGRHFYDKAQARVSEVAQQAAEHVVQALAEHLEGGTS